MLRLLVRGKFERLRKLLATLGDLNFDVGRQNTGAGPGRDDPDVEHALVLFATYPKLRGQIKRRAVSNVHVVLEVDPARLCTGEVQSLARVEVRLSLCRHRSGKN